MHGLLALLFVVAADPALDREPVVVALEAPDGVKGLRSTFDVRAAPDAVLETLWDVRRFRSIFPDVKSLEVLAPKQFEGGRDGATQLEVKFNVNAVFQDATYTLRRDLDRAARTIKWVSIGGDIKTIRGSWAVAATADPLVSRVTYTSYVDVGYFVPTGIVRDVAVGKAKEIATRVRNACMPPR